MLLYLLIVLFIEFDYYVQGEVVNLDKQCGKEKKRLRVKQIFGKLLFFNDVTDA